MEIDNKYKIPYHGKYHKGVLDCPHCDFEPDTLYTYVCGFHDSNIGMLVVVECPKCFEKWSFHCRNYEAKGGHYYYFLSFVKGGMNKHF